MTRLSVWKGAALWKKRKEKEKSCKGLMWGDVDRDCDGGGF